MYPSWGTGKGLPYINWTTRATYWTTLLVFAIFHTARSYFLAMVSEGEVHVLGEGDSVILECSFHADGYSLFDYPVLWRKTQRGEDTQLNIMGNINEPFASSNRFEVAFTSLAPRYKFELSILDVTQLDSGNYTCEVRGPYSAVLGQTTHYLFVRAPVQTVTLADTDHRETGVRTIRAVENLPTRISCLVVGGYPPPSIELSVGRRDITGEFGVYRSTATLSGRRGLRLMTFQTERRSTTFRPRAEDNDARLKCVAAVQGMKTVAEFVRLDIDYSPKLKCSSVGAHVGEQATHLSCEVNAKPSASTTSWIVDSNGTTVTESRHVDGFSTRVVGRPNGIVEVQLHIHNVRHEHFRKYTVIVENAVAETTSWVELSESVLDTRRKQLTVKGFVFDFDDDYETKGRLRKDCTQAVADPRRATQATPPSALQIKKDHNNPPLADSAASVTTNRTAASRDTSRHNYAKMAADPSRTSVRPRADRSAARSLVAAAAVDLTVRQVVVVTFTLFSLLLDSRMLR